MPVTCDRNHNHSAEEYSPLQAGEAGQDHGEAQREDGPRPVLPAQPRGGLHPLQEHLPPRPQARKYNAR